ncbi:MAG: DNA protecting protein DprA [Verrucomicrobia bacterium 21-51-4]|nr:MAG: DNA protecting protein DprA [Verrucomicrobia bacterium 21-51-4]HQU08327.1 DNA-processing protein DprA [Opitutales bacterium]
MSVSLIPADVCLVLTHLAHVGPITAQRLLTAFSENPAEILNSSVSALTRVPGVGPVIAQSVSQWRQVVQIEALKAALKSKGVRFVAKVDSAYPRLLSKIADAPIGLFCLGPKPFNERAIAIVGSRRATLYGLSIAKRLAADLSVQGFQVISGLARGIDGAAHQGALEAQGDTVGVLGCGVDLIYPPEHGALYQRMAAEGLLVSEFALGRPADKQTFPMRNRVIAGLSQAIIVVESDVHGGSMITARLAGEQGRHVFAVPGRVDQSASRGCHELIRDGATLLRNVDDLLEELQYLRQSTLPLDGCEAPRPNLEGLEGRLWAALDEGGPMGLDEMSQLTQSASSQVASTLMLLEIKRWIVKRADGRFEAKPIALQTL